MSDFEEDRPEVQFVLRPVPPPNYIWLALFLFFCCCSPFALVALLYGLRVNRAFMTGEDGTAERFSRKALFWCWLSVLWIILLGFLAINGWSTIQSWC